MSTTPSFSASAFWKAGLVLAALMGFVLSACEKNPEVDCSQCECKCEEPAPCPGAAEKRGTAAGSNLDEIPKTRDGNKPYPVVLVGNVRVMEGRLNSDTASKYVGNKRIVLRECYAPILEKDPNTRGEMDVQFTVSASTGKIIAAIVRESTMKNAEVKNCVESKIRAWRFDPHKGKESVVRFSLVMVGVNF